MTLFEHGPDCTPLVPCGACEVVAWLRTKLSDEDFASLVERVNDLDAPRPKRTYKRRNRHEPTEPPEDMQGAA